MKRFACVLLGGFLLVLSGSRARGLPVPEFRDLFNGQDLTGWVNVNTAEDTWRVKDGLLICSGHPIGVMRSEKQYENFILHIEWMHLEPGGNSGVFVWSSALPNPKSRLPDGESLLIVERGGRKLALVTRQMAYHHVAEGTLAGEPFVVTSEWSATAGSV